MADGALRRQHRYSIVPEHMIRDQRVSDRAFRLWCILDRYAGANDTAFPLRETLADDLQCSVATLDRALVELVKHGWVSKDRRYSGGPNDYTLLEVSESTPVLTHEDTPVSTDDDTLSSPVTTPVLTGEATEKEASPKEASGNDPRSARGARLPDDWWPDDALKAWFNEQEYATWINPRVETENFRDYWHAKSGKDATKIDWARTWQKWMRTAAQRVGYGQTSGTRSLENRHSTADADHDARVTALDGRTAV